MKKKSVKIALGVLTVVGLSSISFAQSSLWPGNKEVRAAAATLQQAKAALNGSIAELKASCHEQNGGELTAVSKESFTWLAPISITDKSSYVVSQQFDCLLPGSRKLAAAMPSSKVVSQ